ncbi:uncharacterized protein LOC141901623 isoform X2 [Tubulanus polymorphus]|uniref:uncharacterized protein LOC141901623 isoform X2 n=1 Tax=Tubulanus polymorphus TaxID=672921 RepID=UPI003DA5FE55
MNLYISGPGSPCADALIQHKCDPNGVCADNLIAPPFYTCNQCATGFEGNGTYCADKNECNGLLNTCSQNCINTYGSFACACNPGNELSAPGSTTCKDVDECALKSDNCYSDGSCTNKDPYSTSQVIERYQCGCPSSTTLFYGKSSERKGFSCKDNCAASKSCHYDCATVGVGNTDTCLCPDALLKGDGTCSLTPLCIPAACPTKNNVECKNGKCVCLPGFRRYSNNYCIDINECLENNQCTPKEGCKNTVGSYTCTTTCPSGYQYTSQSCTDINECALTGSKAVNCSQSAHCVNLSPGFKCQCNQGYSGSGYYCEDVNECALRTDKCEKDLKRGWCTNTVGSYVCKCQPGYKLSPDKHSCIDINECATNNGGCDYQCINTDGSYRCDCAVGWAPVINAIKTCAPIVTCSSVYTNQCQHKKCARLLSGDTCLCPYGYTASGFKCVDVDECKSAIPPCDTISGRGTCINTIGSFRCACLNGYRIGPDNICSDRDGGWTAWSPYTSCSSSCGNGSRKRQRSCTNPTPAGHGNMCVGNMIEIQPCGKLCYLTNTQKQTMVELHLKGTTSMKMNAMRSQLTTILSQSLNNYCSFSAYTVGYCCNLLGLNTYKPPSTMEFTNASLVTLHPNTPLDIMVNHRPRTVILFSLQSLNPNPLCVLARSSHGVGRRKRQVTGNQLSSQQVAYIFHNRTTQALLTTDIETAIKTSTGKATTALLTTYVNPANSVIVPVVDNTTVTTHLPTRTTPKSSVGGGGGNGGGVGGGGGSTPGSNGINGIPEWVIIVSIVAGVLLLLVILIIALYYIHSKERIEMKKKKEKENEMKNNQSATADDLNW